MIGAVAIVFLVRRPPNAARARYWRRMRYKIMAVWIAMLVLGALGLVEMLRVSPFLYALYSGSFLSVMAPAISMEVVTRPWEEPLETHRGS